MAELLMNGPGELRLKELLVIEQRLQELVRNATEQAAYRIAEARAASERRLAAAEDEAARADAERARAEHAAHNDALSAIRNAHQASMAAITISDERVDELARWALARVIGTGEPA